MENPTAWYVVKLETGQCAILTENQLPAPGQSNENTSEVEKWGPFASQADAIARRVGLIRSGKCQPA